MKKNNTKSIDLFECEKCQILEKRIDEIENELYAIKTILDSNNIGYKPEES